MKIAGTMLNRSTKAYHVFTLDKLITALVKQVGRGTSTVG